MELSFKKEKKFKTEKPTFDNGVKWVILGLITLQGFLTAATYNSASMGFNSFSQFLLGLNLVVFGAIFLTFQQGRKRSLPYNI